MKQKSKASRQPSHGIVTPLLTVDPVLFTYDEKMLKVLLVRRSSEPEKGKWGLPGGIVDIDIDRDIESTARRKLVEKTSVEPPYLEQLQTIGSRARDPRGWSVTVCYTALIAHQACAGHVDTVSDVRWVELEAAETMRLAFDHREIIAIARERLRQRALYSISSGYALAEEFTLAELQHLHELLIGKSIQKRSFRRRIEQADLLIDTGKKRQEGGRPAALYRMKPESMTHRFVRNLDAS